ncbi:DNA adenine methylase [Moraxella oblonga]|uniref:DNA adenine methylase n=1 Tax=Moraxella oblonga TaxID=200413 RepID=UPI00082BD6A0|nr:Dam family site-specific DNA-(adenine-N6)-methyltransferase [Moraxella oblonga]
MKVIIPPIKSQGIKTKLVPDIAQCIPDNFSGTWIEPFMGTGVVGFNLVVKNAIMCDTNPHLIKFYQTIQSQEITPNIVREYLIQEGQYLLEKGEEYYYLVRTRFNENADPLDFLFLNRAGFNGMIRFNKKGEFNIPFCRKPNRFAQAYITKIVNQVNAISQIIHTKNIEFICQDFEKTIQMAGKDDLIYCDPPYIDRHTDYFNTWSEQDECQLYHLLSQTQSKFILSTWHHNQYRQNHYVEKFWQNFIINKKEHFYHIGAKENNRNPMTEALVRNFESNTDNSFVYDKQIALF